MTLFKTSKPSNSPSRPSLKHDNGLIRISSDASPSSTYTPPQVNKLHHRSPDQSIHPFSSSPYSDASYRNLPLKSPLTLLSESPISPSHPSTHHHHPPSTPLSRSRSILGLQTSFPRQPHQAKSTFQPKSIFQPKSTFSSRLLSPMASHESGHPSPIASFPVSAPSTFRLLKSKIFSSVPSKSKAFQSPKLPPPASSSSRNLYLFPGLNSFSDPTDQLTQNPNNERDINLMRQRSKSNNMVHPPQESLARDTAADLPPSPLPYIVPRSEPSLEFQRSGLSLELLRTRSSIDLSTTMPSNDLQRCVPTQSNHPNLPPTNRIVIDVNANRLNYPSFNNKAAAQNGPRVLRLMSQVSNSNPPAPVGLTASSPRPTPIPHGGSGAILTIHPPNSIRSTNLPQNLRHLDPTSSMAPPESVLPSPGPHTLNIQYSVSNAPATQEHNNDPSPHSVESLRVSSSGETPAPSRSHHSYSQFGPPSLKDVLTCDNSQDIPDLTPRLPLPNPSSTPKNLDTYISNLASNNVLMTKATPQSVVANQTFSAEPNSPVDALASSRESHAMEFAEFSNFLSYPDLGTPQPHPPISHIEPITTHTHSILFARPPSTSMCYLTSSNALSLPSTSEPIKLCTPPLPPSLQILGPSQPPKTESTPFPSFAEASTPSNMVTPFSPMLSPRSTMSPNSPAALPSSSPRPHEPSEADIYSLASSHPSSPPPPPDGCPALSQRLPRPQSPSLSSNSQIELEHARKIILGLQNEVKQLQNASSEAPLSSRTNQPVLPISADHTTAPEPSDNAEQSKFLADNASHPAPTFQASPNPKPERSSATTGTSETYPLDSPSSDYPLKPASQSRSDDELEVPGKPSRLPIAKHRLRDVASVEFSRNLHSRTRSTASTMSRTWKVSLDSNGSTEYRYATSQSHSTHRTTPSPISTSLKPRLRKGSCGNTALLPASSRAKSPQVEMAWPRSTQDAIYPSLGATSSLVLRMPERSDSKDLGRQMAGPLDLSRPSSMTSHSSSSSGRLAQPFAGTTQSHRRNEPTPPIRNQGTYRRGSAPESYSENSRHHSRRLVPRSGLSSVEEDLVFSEEAGDSSLNMLTKVELLAMLENQKAQFVIERHELLDALRQSREKAAQSSREWQRLRAEDGWKTEQLNKAREEVDWLSRLAATLELDKSRLEERVASMANEVKRLPGGSRKGTTPTSQRAGPMRDVIHKSSSGRSPNHIRSAGSDNSSARSSDGVSLAHSTPKSYSSKTRSSAIHRASHMSQDSVGTICPNEPNPKLHESPSHNHSPHAIDKWRGRQYTATEVDPISPGTRQCSAKQRIVRAQRSESDFRPPLTASNLHSLRFDRAESVISRQKSPRAPSTTRSIALRQNHSEYQHSQGGSFQGQRHADVIVEERDEEVDRGDARSNFSSHRGFQNSNYLEHEEPLDYQDVVYEIDAHKIHSRTNSAESLAISPSSTVFADHQRNHGSRTSAYNRGSQSSHRNPDSRNSLISLQLRPEDELFLEDYLEEDEILSDDEF